MWFFTTALALLCLVMMFRVPGDENKRLRKDLKKNASKSMAVDQLYAALDSAQFLTNRIKDNKSTQYVDDLKLFADDLKNRMDDRVLQTKISKLLYSQYYATMEYSKLYEEQKEELKDMEDEVEDAEDDLDDCQKDMLRLQMQMGQPGF